MRTTPTISLSAVLTVTQPYIGNFTQSSTNSTITTNSANGGEYAFANFTGMTANVPVIMKTSGGKILLSARL